MEKKLLADFAPFYPGDIFADPLGDHLKVLNWDGHQLTYDWILVDGCEVKHSSYGFKTSFPSSVLSIDGFMFTEVKRAENYNLITKGIPLPTTGEERYVTKYVELTAFDIELILRSVYNMPEGMLTVDRGDPDQFVFRQMTRVK